ncbi:MAG TPA: DUF167 family protein, partial [Alphaproteobacteria bacterium]|nr:DUF167 family protein [Alphaproteobacteria bacterium]
MRHGVAGEALCRPVADGVRLLVRLQPGAGADSIDGLDTDAEGRPRLRARVTAAPEKGRANKALMRLLAKAWGVAPGTLEIVAG